MRQWTVLKLRGGGDLRMSSNLGRCPWVDERSTGAMSLRGYEKRKEGDRRVVGRGRLLRDAWAKVGQSTELA